MSRDCGGGVTGSRAATCRPSIRFGGDRYQVRFWERRLANSPGALSEAMLLPGSRIRRRESCSEGRISDRIVRRTQVCEARGGAGLAGVRAPVSERRWQAVAGDVVAQGAVVNAQGPGACWEATGAFAGAPAGQRLGVRLAEGAEAGEDLVAERPGRGDDLRADVGRARLLGARGVGQRCAPAIGTRYVFWRGAWRTRRAP